MTSAPTMSTAPAISSVTTAAGDLGPGDAGPGRMKRMVRGRPTDPAWVRPSLLTLLTGTAFLYIWGLGASGWANSFYSAAVQAGSTSWKAFFFGSSDAANFITVDKPPASLWVMDLSARVFGVNAWSILVPQALEGVATVAVLYATVRRWSRCRRDVGAIVPPEKERRLFRVASLASSADRLNLSRSPRCRASLAKFVCFCALAPRGAS